jgi:3-methyladenine DNA glycosylase/8-oxoguanine DNA glycosylase
VAHVEGEVWPPSPYSLPAGGGGDGVMRAGGGVLIRLLCVDHRPVLTRAWSPGPGRVVIRADAVDPTEVARLPDRDVAPAEDEHLEAAVDRMRFALGVDDDLGPFHQRFKRDELLGPVIRRRPRARPSRRPWPWEALAWAVTKQLIDTPRAAAIQRRIVRRWGPKAGPGGERSLHDVPGAAAVAALAPAELESTDLSPGRAIALRRVAAEVASGRADPDDPTSDRRLRAITGIGPWTLQCLALHGRGDLDSLPAGDLAYLKLVGRLTGLARRATVEEVEEFFAPYAPYRGLAGHFALVGYHHTVAQGPPLRKAA